MELEISKKAKIGFYILIVLIAGVLLVSVFSIPKDVAPVVYEYDFETPDQLNDGFLLVSQWGEFSNNSKLVTIRDGILVIDSSKNEAPQFVLTAPIDVGPNSVVTITRKVKISRGENIFAGGMALFQTTDSNLIPSPITHQSVNKKGNSDEKNKQNEEDSRGEGTHSSHTLDKNDTNKNENQDVPDDSNGWYRRMGDGIVLIEYSYDLIHKESRPGKDIFRFLCADWQYNDNYELIPPVYDKWVEETLIFDMRVNKVTYSIGNKKYSLNSLRPDKPAFRLLMHAYGVGKGNKIEIDDLKIKVEDKTFRK